MIRPQTCPICDRELTPEPAAGSGRFPFCSERCRLVDLYRWSEGRYAIVDPLVADDPRLAAELEAELESPEGEPERP